VKETLEPVLSKTLKPICPRDNHQMKYEANGIQWKTPLDDHVQTMAAYHCDFAGCNVGYDHMNGYFTVVNAPERPFLVEEPSASLNVQGMVHGCIDVKMSKATPVLRGGVASRDATTCTQTSADCDSSRRQKTMLPPPGHHQPASVSGRQMVDG